MKTINIIGAGRLGKTIARLIVQYKVGQIQGVCNTSSASAEEAVHFIGSGVVCDHIAQLPPAEITIISTPDDVIRDVAEELSHSPQLQPSSLIFHCSGSLTSDLLSTLKEKSCRVASAHPMRSFAIPAISVEKYQGTLCAIEGDENTVEEVSELFSKIGSVTFSLNKEKKSLYHASGVFSSNYLITLFNTAKKCLLEADIDEEVANQLILSLMSGTIKNLESTGSARKSLTGPIKRGDSETVKKHIQAFTDTKIEKLYRVLGANTIEIADLESGKKEKLIDVLDRTFTDETPKNKILAKL